MFPADFATIYDLNPLYSAGTTEQESRSLSRRAATSSSATLPHSVPSQVCRPTRPTVTIVGVDPGLVANDQDESTLDVEWSGAVAPAATVNLVVAQSTATTDGIDLAAAYIVNHAMAPVVSVSYGSCEQEMGAAELAFYNEPLGAGSKRGNERPCRIRRCRRGRLFAPAQTPSARAGCEWTLQLALCHLCRRHASSTKERMRPQYWSAANSAGYGSALGYIPEVVWNESATDGGMGFGLPAAEQARCIRSPRGRAR